MISNFSACKQKQREREQSKLGREREENACEEEVEREGELI